MTIVFLICAVILQTAALNYASMVVSDPSAPLPPEAWYALGYAILAILAAYQAGAQ